MSIEDVTSWCGSEAGLKSKSDNLIASDIFYIDRLPVCSDTTEVYCIVPARARLRHACRPGLAREGEPKKKDSRHKKRKRGRSGRARNKGSGRGYACETKFVFSGVHLMIRAPSSARSSAGLLFAHAKFVSFLPRHQVNRSRKKAKVA